MIMRRVVRLARQLHWARRGWSTERDREYHDGVFAGQDYDPFSDAYPGRLTIRRFADLAAERIHPADRVLDLGCGPGEITCELARRFPTAQFVGIDHSVEAIARAERLAERLELTNVRFEPGDVERHALTKPVGLVTLFNAFHHLLDPEGFVERIGRSCDRFFLIEPAGNWLGQWQKSLDLDWLTESLFVIRDRLEHQFGLTPISHSGSLPASESGEPVEHRYSIEDFSRFFTGFGVEIVGTVAGLDAFGVRPEAGGSLREDIGRTIYTLVVELEATLRRHDMDLAAKHWAIYAQRGLAVSARKLPSLPEQLVHQPLTGPYDVEYAAFDGPEEMRTSTAVDATVHVLNKGWKVWNSFDEDSPVLVSYHWLNARGDTIVEDGLRSRLPRPVAPGERCAVALKIQAPETPGRFTLALDLVQEHVTWFSRAGVPPLKIPIRVR